MKVPNSITRLAPISLTMSDMKAPCSGPICMPALEPSFAVSARSSASTGTSRQAWAA